MKKQNAFIHIQAPGFYLRGEFPIYKLRALVDFAVECVEAGQKEYPLTLYSAVFAAWQSNLEYAKCFLISARA